MAALITDGLRAQYLEREGYEAQILEFIDMEHTPKNILIRAVKRNQKADQKESVRRQQIEASIGNVKQNSGCHRHWGAVR